MPRGVAIDGVRQRLFAAAETVILREGAGGLRGRAVTTEAGVATGLLHAHFGDFEGFLVAYAVDRSFLLTAAAGEIESLRPPDLGDALASLPQPAATAFARLLAARPDLQGKAAEILGAESAGFAGLTDGVAQYLTAARDDGHLAATTDPAALAYAIIAVLLRAWHEGDREALWRPVIRALLSSAATA
ncbi:TetR/AcrR family transcriptional regulator [Tsukamurella strandjordii]|uniref:TetR/AcrR family transcriptional regulator n=1 Tax=Tsukamurella strandjordii TaxID=147577 RepID=A0AA90SNN4_9ACTN|nr:TetR/AcrR family transcriptional regulator [Tsukamurella strandjordii]MDP0400373.1 TetR/AcrR family transcriptional regulator [Tsukamurella strandjordii]